MFAQECMAFVARQKFFGSLFGSYVLNILKIFVQLGLFAVFQCCIDFRGTAGARESFFSHCRPESSGTHRRTTQNCRE